MIKKMALTALALVGLLPGVAFAARWLPLRPGEVAMVLHGGTSTSGEVSSIDGGPAFVLQGLEAVEAVEQEENRRLLDLVTPIAWTNDAGCPHPRIMEAVVGPRARKIFGEAASHKNEKRQYNEIIWRGFKRFGPDALALEGGLHALFHDKKVFPQDPSADLVRAAHRFSRFVTALSVLIVSRVVQVDIGAVAWHSSDMLMSMSQAGLFGYLPYLVDNQRLAEFFLRDLGYLAMVVQQRLQFMTNEQLVALTGGKVPFFPGGEGEGDGAGPQPVIDLAEYFRTSYGVAYTVSV